MKKLIIAMLALGIAFSSFGATRYLYLDAANNSPFVITTSEGGTDTLNINMMDDGTPIVSANYTPLLVIGKTDRFADTTTITGTATNGSAATFLLTTASYSANWEGRPVKLMYRTGSAGSYAYYYRRSGTLRFDDTLAADGDPRAVAYFGGYELGSTVAAAEHGAGAIGTYSAPVTSRRTVNGVIITEVRVDLTGLGSYTTANDVIGIAAATPDSYIHQHTVAADGIVFKTEWICLETPAGGDLEVNVTTSASALAYNDAGGTTYVSDSGALQIGQMVQNLVPQMTTAHYLHMAGGAGGTTGTYTAGQFILRLYGHPAL